MPLYRPLERTCDGVVFRRTVRHDDSGATVSHAHLRSFEHAVCRQLFHYGAVGPETFRFVRKAHNISKDEIAALLDVPRNTITAWEAQHNDDVPLSAMCTLYALVGLCNSSFSTKALLQRMQSFRNHKNAQSP